MVHSVPELPLPAVHFFSVSPKPSHLLTQCSTHTLCVFAVSFGFIVSDPAILRTIEDVRGLSNPSFLHWPHRTACQRVSSGGVKAQLSQEHLQYADYPKCSSHFDRPSPKSPRPVLRSPSIPPLPSGTPSQAPSCGVARRNQCSRSWLYCYVGDWKNAENRHEQFEMVKRRV